jgi:glycosyltransferase involved in cell wall biosynthesis
MIVVDDSSRDRSPKIVEEYASRDPRIRLIRHRDNYGAEGLGKTYNEALDASSGEFIAILEGDDFWAPEKLSTQVPEFQDNNVVLVYSDFDEVLESGKLIKRHRAGIDQSSLKTDPPRNLEFFSQLRYFAPNTVIIRKSSLLRVGGFVSANIPVVDYPTFLKLSLEGVFVWIPKSLAYYQRHDESVAFSNAETISRGSMYFMREFLQENEEGVKRFGFALEELQQNAEQALQWQWRTAAYFEGKYNLIFEDNYTARRCFLRAVVSRETPLRHRIAASLGILASFSSSSLFLKLLNLRDRLYLAVLA